MVDTPNVIEYKTPIDDTVLPHLLLSPRHPGNHNEARDVVIEPEDTTTEAQGAAQDRLLDLKGDLTSWMDAVFRLAQMHADHANLEKAELLFLKALKGYGVLLGPTHEDATKVAINVAEFYTEQGQFDDADMVAEDLCQHHIRKYGIKHRRTQQVIQQVADLLNGCNRANDALAFVSRSKQLAEADAEETFRKPKKRSKSRRQGSISPRHVATPPTKPLDNAEEITAGSDPDQVGYGTHVARTHVAANDEVLKGFLEAIADHCGHQGEVLEIQILGAACDSLKLYGNLEPKYSHNLVISSAISRAEAIICRQKWKKGDEKSVKIMEALVELAASLLKAGFGFKADATFTKIRLKAEDDFGWDNERTIWAKISIGLVYQRYRSWESAKPWFESAREASFATWGEEDWITRSLETAMEERHFPHVWNEIGPFRFLLKVSDSTRICNRLSLDWDLWHENSYS